jgi:hypothetical protein
VVLNQSLYNRLKTISGEVRVSHTGRAAKPVKKFSHGKWVWGLRPYGESYPASKAGLVGVALF